MPVVDELPSACRDKTIDRGHPPVGPRRSLARLLPQLVNGSNSGIINASRANTTTVSGAPTLT